MEMKPLQNIEYDKQKKQTLTSVGKNSFPIYGMQLILFWISNWIFCFHFFLSIRIFIKSNSILYTMSVLILKNKIIFAGRAMMVEKKTCYIVVKVEQLNKISYIVDSINIQCDWSQRRKNQMNNFRWWKNMEKWNIKVQWPVKKNCNNMRDWIHFFDIVLGV